MTAPQLLTVLQAAERLGVSDDTVRALVHAGRLSYVRVTTGSKKGLLRFREQDLQAFIDRNQHVAAADLPAESSRRTPRRSLADVPEASRYA